MLSTTQQLHDTLIVVSILRYRHLGHIPNTPFQESSVPYYPHPASNNGAILVAWSLAWCTTRRSVTARISVCDDLSLAALSFGLVEESTTETDRVDIHMALDTLPSTFLAVPLRLGSLLV